MYRTKDQVAQEIIAEGRRRGITPRGIVIALATGLVESNLVVYANAKVPESLNLPHDAVGSDGKSVGVFQQQVVMGNGWWWGDARTCMDPTLSAGLFYDRLAKRDYNHGDPGAHAQAIQGSAFPDRYAQRMGEAQSYYDRLAGAPPVTNQPAYEEHAAWSPNNQSRNGTKIDLFLLHTQEGNGDADSLAAFLGNPANQVSYHYTIDNRVAVRDIVDTDNASWSVLSANNRSINLCFAGSYSKWTRDEWLYNMTNAIDIAAYLAVQDCQKYGIAIKVLTPPYNSNPPGISDHKYVTQWLKDGTHTDVGDNFPWDVFTAAINKYAGNAPAQPQPGAPVPDRRFPQDFTDRELLEWLVNQLGPGDPSWPSKGMTLRDKVWTLGTKDAS